MVRVGFVVFVSNIFNVWYKYPCCESEIYLFLSSLVAFLKGSPLPWWKFCVHESVGNRINSKLLNATHWNIFEFWHIFSQCGFLISFQQKFQSYCYGMASQYLNYFALKAQMLWALTKRKMIGYIKTISDSDNDSVNGLDPDSSPGPVDPG